MSDLKRGLTEAASAAFSALGLPPELGRVTPSDRPDLADFQCNGALAAAKLARRNPREIAAEVAAALKDDPRLAAAEVAGAGFVNFRASKAALAQRADEIAADARAGAERVEHPRRVIVDYAGPNVAKPMHVGHLRASIIGESLKRIFRFRGDEVWGDAHFGDWGFQMGLLIAALAEEGRVDDFMADGDGPFPAESSVTLEDLERVYPHASNRTKRLLKDETPNPAFDPDFLASARKATAELQAGRPGYRALWRRFTEVSRPTLEREFHALGVDFDLWKGESDVDHLIPEMVEDLQAKGLLVDDQGARIVRVAREDDKAKVAPLIVVSSEGSSMYGTTDLATVVDRRREQDPDLMLYVIDERQANHLVQVFRAAALAGYAKAEEMEHIGFGTMNGPDGKPFKTREGGVLKLHDLITMARDKARERLHEADLGSELPPEEFEDTAHKVAVAALKFADLQNHRTTSYVFDLDRFTSFEGKTGPYLLYQAVRIKSLLRKADEAGVQGGGVLVDEAAERDLVLTLDAFDQAVTEAYDKRAPNAVAEHAYRLAQSFSRFYAACPVLAAPDSEIRASRLALSQATLKQLELALSLLGIATPARM